MDAILKDRRAAFVFIAPALIVYTLVLLAPIVWSLGYTFYSGNVLTGFAAIALWRFRFE